jgi:uncharacterized protein
MPESTDAILKISKEDRQLQTDKRVLKSLPNKRKKILHPLKQVESVLDKLKEQEEQICGQIRERETLVQVEQEKIRRSDERMMSIKNQKEYVASQKEIEIARKTIKKVEDQIIELEQKKDAVVHELSTVLAEYKEKKETVGAAEKQVLEEEREILNRIEAYEELKKELVPKIDPDLIETYKKLTSRKIVPAAVEISGSNCMGCAMSIPAQLFNEIIRDSVGKCPHCGRLLFYKEPEKPVEEVKPKTVAKATKPKSKRTVKSTKSKQPSAS